MNNKRYSTKSIIEAGLMSIMVFLIMMITTYVPVIGGLGAFVMPLPITILYLRHSKGIAILAVVVSGFLIAVFNNFIVAIGTIALYGISGVALGYCISKQYKAIKTILIISIANLFGIIIDFSLSIYVLLGTTLTQLISQIIDEFKEALTIYDKLGMDVSNNPVYQQFQQIDVHTIFVNLPGIVMFAAIIISWLNYIVSKKILKRFRYTVNDLPPFSQWFLDNRVGALLIAVICIGIIMQSKGIGAGEYIFYSAIALLQQVLMIVGFSIISYYLINKFNITKRMTTFICIIMFVFQLTNIAFFLGLFDLVFDIRGLDPNSLGNAIRNRMKKSQ